MSLFRLSVCLVAISVPLFAQGLPLEVHNPTSQSLTQEPVTFGIPVPRFAQVIRKLEDFSLAVRDPNSFDRLVDTAWEALQAT